MDGTKTIQDEVRRLLEDYDARALDRIEDWDGKALEGLMPYLTEEEYQMLLDNLQTTEE